MNKAMTEFLGNQLEDSCVKFMNKLANDDERQKFIKILGTRLKYRMDFITWKECEKRMKRSLSTEQGGKGE